MSDLNSFSVIGRLTKDAVLKTLSTGTQLAEFCIANDRGHGQYAKTYFFNVKFWGKGSANIAKYLVKGKRVAVTGEVQIDSWDNREKVVISTMDVSLMDGPPQEEKEKEDTPASVMREVNDIPF
jgi:single-strand DNA-binding protein